MPITFKSKHAPDILMFESIALQLIKLMGHSGAVPGALAIEDLPGALQRLEQDGSRSSCTRAEVQHAMGVAAAQEISEVGQESIEHPPFAQRRGERLDDRVLHDLRRGWMVVEFEQLQSGQAHLWLL